MVKAGIPCSFEAGGVGSIPANSDAQNMPSFRPFYRQNLEVILSMRFVFFSKQKTDSGTNLIKSIA
jgi:hypothetical protein